MCEDGGVESRVTVTRPTAVGPERLVWLTAQDLRQRRSYPRFLPDLLPHLLSDQVSRPLHARTRDGRTTLG